MKKVTKEDKITSDDVRSLLNYDLLTGDFTWAVKLGRKVKIGAKAGTWLRGYRVIRIFGSQYQASRLAWLYVTGNWPQYQIDHIDGDRGNNRISNLRDVEQQINLQNRRKAQRNSKLGVLGVRKFRGGYQARIGRKHLGIFKTIELAQAAYIQAKRASHEGCTL